MEPTWPVTGTSKDHANPKITFSLMYVVGVRIKYSVMSDWFSPGELHDGSRNRRDILEDWYSG